MCYSIKFLGDDEMPEGHDFLFLELPGGAAIIYRESALTAQTLMDSWAAYRALGGRTKPPKPLRVVNPMLRTA